MWPTSPSCTRWYPGLFYCNKPGIVGHQTAGTRYGVRVPFFPYQMQCRVVPLSYLHGSSSLPRVRLFSEPSSLGPLSWQRSQRICWHVSARSLARTASAAPGKRLCVSCCDPFPRAEMIGPLLSSHYTFIYFTYFKGGISSAWAERHCQESKREGVGPLSRESTNRTHRPGRSTRDSVA